MGQIQQGINQLFTTAGFMARLSPELEKLGEKRKLKKEAEVVSKAGKQATESARATIEEAILEPKPEKQLELREAAHRDLAEGMGMIKRKESIAKELFELDPSEESYDKYKKMRESIEKDLTPQFKKMQESLEKMRQKGMAKVEQRAQRRNFMKALGAEQVNFGSGAEGTVGDLPKNLQKAIASGFSKSERKELLDKYYGGK